MTFIDWFCGYSLVWIFLGLIVVDLAIMAGILWLLYQEWRWRK